MFVKRIFLVNIKEKEKEKEKEKKIKKRTMICFKNL